MTCAPLAKSPNCASQIDELVRVGEAEAELEAEHGVLGEHAVDDDELRLARRGCCRAARSGAPVSTSCSTAWRWLNVPRPCPGRVRRTGDALEHERADRERLGAAPVDRARPRATIAARCSISLRDLRVRRGSPPGTRVNAAATSRSTSAGTAVSALQSSPAQPSPFHRPPKANTGWRGMKSRA